MTTESGPPPYCAGSSDPLDLVHLALRETPTEAQLPALSTKLGGRPDLTPATPCPTGDDGEPAQFGFQVNLTDLAARFPALLPWPPDGGLLQFFVAYEHPTVLLHRDLSALRPTRGPVDELREYRLEPAPGTLLGNDIPPSAQQAIAELRSRFTVDEEAALQRWLFDDPPTHQVGGSAFWIQDSDIWTAPWLERGVDPWTDDAVDPDDEDEKIREYAEQAYADGWRLILQFGSMSDNDYVFGDDGLFYFLAPLDADGRWNVDRTQVIFQSH